MPGCDMLVNLSTLPALLPAPEGMHIKRVIAGDLSGVLSFIRENFSESWVSEAHKAILASPGGCFIATHAGRILGFACYDATARGFFGPIGVLESARGQGVGAALLLRTLHAMAESGYGYAVIGWVDDAKPFYEKVVGAMEIPGADPDHSVYKNRIAFE